jgi:hypothetical protein
MYISDVQKKVPNSLFDTIRFSLYKTLKGKEQIGEITLSQLFNIIKENQFADPSDFEWARQDATGLQELKTSLPCCTPHGVLSSGQKANHKIIALSGCVFIDIDLKEDPRDLGRIKEELFKRQEVIACWTSLSGLGIHGLALINNLTTDPDHFKACHRTYLSVLEKDLNCTCDNKVTNLSAGLVIASDPNLLVKSCEYEPFHVELQKTGHDVYYNKTSSIIHDDLFFADSKTRFKVELNEYTKDVIHIPSGKLYYECSLPFGGFKNGKAYHKKIKRGSRNTILSIYIHNFLCLNPNAEEALCMTILRSINTIWCESPLEDNELKSLFLNKYRVRTKLTPIGARLKYYWINPNAKDKLKLLAAFRKEVTLSRLEDFFSTIPNWTEKITISKIAEECELSSSTIKRYLTPHMKSLYDTHNAQYTYTRKKK